MLLQQTQCVDARVGRDRLLDKGEFKAVKFVQGYAENLPFPNHRFENVFCAFGFRNFTDQAKGISECVRVLKPGGQLTILEFSQPKNASIDFVFHQYVKWIPSIGDFIAQMLIATNIWLSPFNEICPHNHLLS